MGCSTYIMLYLSLFRCRYDMLKIKTEKAEDSKTIKEPTRPIPLLISRKEKIQIRAYFLARQRNKQGC